MTLREQGGGGKSYLQVGGSKTVFGEGLYGAGRSGRNHFCVIGPLSQGTCCERANYAHINCLGINCPSARTSVTQKNCFWGPGVL